MAVATDMAAWCFATGLSAFLAIGSRADASAFVALAVIGVRATADKGTSVTDLFLTLGLATIALVQFATFGTPKWGQRWHGYTSPGLGCS